MATGLLTIYLFLQKWLVPFLFTIGLIFFVYGFIVYYIIGHKSGDEDRMEHGRQNLLKAFIFFSIALLVHLVVFLVGWLGMTLEEKDATDRSLRPVDSDASIERGRETLVVPDVPRSNE